MSGGILVPIDLSDVTETVLDEAVKLAGAFGAKLWLIHVAQPRPDFVGYEVGPVYIRDSVARRLRLEHQKLQNFQDVLRRKGVDATAMLVPGEPVEKVLQEARRLDVDRIVLGSHGHGALYHLLGGGVCKGVLKGAPCPVVIVPIGVAARTEVPAPA